MSFKNSHKILAVLGLILVVFVAFSVPALFSVKQDVYSWHQKVTLNITTQEGEELSASSIQKITWRRNTAFSFGGTRWLYEIRGEMPHLYLSDGNLIVALYRDAMAWHLLDFIEQRVDPRIGLAWYVNEKTLRALEKDTRRHYEIASDNEHFPNLIKIPDGKNLDSTSYYKGARQTIRIQMVDGGEVPYALSEAVDWLDDLPKSEYLKNGESTVIFTTNDIRR